MENFKLPLWLSCTPRGFFALRAHFFFMERGILHFQSFRSNAFFHLEYSLSTLSLDALENTLAKFGNTFSIRERRLHSMSTFMIWWKQKFLREGWRVLLPLKLSNHAILENWKPLYGGKPSLYFFTYKKKMSHQIKEQSVAWKIKSILSLYHRMLSSNKLHLYKNKLEDFQYMKLKFKS